MSTVERWSPAARARFALPYDPEEAPFAGATMTSSCGLCDFSFSGLVEDAKRAGREHALKVHGLQAKKRRRP